LSEIPTEDRYQDVADVVTRVLSEEEFPTGPIERFEVTCTASGEATYRVWEARAEEPFSGVYTPF
jgi:hypothetical protein